MKNPKSILTKNKNFILNFKYPQLEIIVDPYSEEYNSLEEIYDISKKYFNNIFIDKSYVKFKNTKYKKTFILESDWFKLCKLLISTNLGKKANLEQNIILIDLYSMMIICYAYLFYYDLGYNINNIYIQLKDKSKFMVVIKEDKIIDNYIGNWKDW